MMTMISYEKKALGDRNFPKRSRWLPRIASEHVSYCYSLGINEPSHTVVKLKVYYIIM